MKLPLTITDIPGHEYASIFDADGLLIAPAVYKPAAAILVHSTNTHDALAEYYLASTNFQGVVGFPDATLEIERLAEERFVQAGKAVARTPAPAAVGAADAFGQTKDGCCGVTVTERCPGCPYDKSVEALALAALTRHFDEFIGACINAFGEPTTPTSRALAQARACLPLTATNSFKGAKK